MFKASLGKSVKIITFIFVGLFLLIGIVLMGLFIVSLFEEPFNRKSIMLPIVTFGILGLLYWIYAGRTIGYEISNEGVKIVKGNDFEFIKKDTILEVKNIEYSDLRFSIRTFGNGGLFGYSGSFRNKKFDDMTWFLTRKDTLVMIVTEKQKFVLSPDDRELFITKASELIK